ncbi:MAG: family 43 glycosylhydrolase [Candidatus Hydrogenedentes bacterium]|nr:family 43 glycosylhydrolase [Candidatus Hydrogenedentota bacterium]
MRRFISIFALLVCASLSSVAPAATPAAAPMPRRGMMQDSDETTPLSQIRMRDVCILPDPVSKTYYMIGPGGRSVRQYTSKDLATWQGPHTIFTPPQDVWGDIPVGGIWAPELHAYKGRYYLFLTFDTRNRFPEQWRNWRPRVTRGSAILGSDSPSGPFTAFQDHATPPADMMTLDGTLWVEDGVPHMVFAHEWVQITIGTIEYVQLKDDLSAAVTEPTRLFDAQDAPWALKQSEGCYVTDAPYLRKSKSGKLFMTWSSFGKGGYTTGVAVSDSGKLAGPWTQRPEPIYTDDGGHAMLFDTFDGKLMMVLHSPNGRGARPRIFELEDTGETLRVLREFTGNP